MKQGWDTEESGYQPKSLSNQIGSKWSRDRSSQDGGEKEGSQAYDGYADSLGQGADCRLGVGRWRRCGKLAAGPPPRDSEEKQAEMKRSVSPSRI